MASETMALEGTAKTTALMTLHDIMNRFNGPLERMGRLEAPIVQLEPQKQNRLLH